MSIKIIAPFKRIIDARIPIVKIGNARFTRIEADVMEYVTRRGKERGVEILRVINKKRRLEDLRDFCNESKHSVGIHSWATDFTNSTLIHNHPNGFPVSVSDISFMMHNCARKIIATTPCGGFSLMKQPKVSRDLWRRPKPDFSTLGKLRNELDTKKCELGLDKETILNLDEKIIKEYIDFAIPQLQKFANEVGFTFKHKLNL
ncbi:MAG: hypothetical protein A2Y25_03535 [Candidatus Melainabacteria bacterium GWF2_37_15]|nr:MAG: hypothetical protein A2Y25_03535 [Candidatus Melainabacteria bacterium GWF2_37_15]